MIYSHSYNQISPNPTLTTSTFNRTGNWHQKGAADSIYRFGRNGVSNGNKVDGGYGGES